MLKIDNSLLEEIGLGSLPEAEKNSFLKHIYETLEMRVGIRLADQMTNEQLDEFERYFEAKDDAGAFKWLETNFPNYKDIVQQEFDKLKAEVAQSAPQILSASQAQAVQAPQAPATPDPASVTLPLQQPFSQTSPAESAPVVPPMPQPAPFPSAPEPGMSQVPPPPAPPAPPQPPFTPPVPPTAPQPPFPDQQPPAGPQPA